MIFIITNNKDFLPNPIYRFTTIDILNTYLDSVTEIALDCETKGFDCHTKDLISVQIGDYTDQYIIDCTTVDILQLKDRLEGKIVLGQNLKFDIKFLMVKGIYLMKIYDTFVAEKVIYCGLDMMRAGLDHLTERYCNVHLDKSVRVDIPREGLTPRVISYAADDIKYLFKIREGQYHAAKERDLVSAINLENRFTPCLAYIEYCGFKLDAAKWKTKMATDLLKMQNLEAKLNEWILEKGLQSHIKQQLEFFEDQTCNINWSSPLQVVELFEELGIDCSIQDKGVVKKSVEADVIQKYVEEYEIVKMYLEYKKSEKVVTTYGEGFLLQINKATGRVHTEFKQVLDTGRISSGGKGKGIVNEKTGKKTNLINFQNIPADPFTRSCFVAEEGNTLVGCDYSGQEQVLLANFSMDEGLLKFYDEGLGDMHSYNASLMYPELKGLSLEEIKTKHKDKRQAAKSVGFSSNYGGNGSTIAESMNISVEEGNKIYNNYMSAFPGLKKYFDMRKKQALTDGYIGISDLTKRKSYVHYWDDYKALSDMMTKSYWEEYRKEKEFDSPRFRSMKKDVKQYFYYRGEIERKALNFGIQGTAAEATKMSCIYIFDYIIKNNLFGTVKFVNTIHDENVIECPLDMADKIAKVVGDAMVKAGTFFCKRVPLLAVPEINFYWKK